MIISTTSQLEGRPIAEYLGVVSAESVQGINFVRDFFTRVRDVLGGRSQTLESALREAREQATEELKARAQQLQADAVVGVDYEISMPSVQGGMVVVFVTGTAVRLR
ncbi:YbjQ family protein [Pseudomonas sp. NY5710]|uniref:YbjQ family protein n=1 Tax=Pseudomonas TaxID=286 RepID=UPI00156FF95D|nr:YbjQ family protein [Pseudomonas sp. NY5710]QKL02296.1 heavy metal-binding domain-containing protein [Pseudomonas sp. NY5710]